MNLTTEVVEKRSADRHYDESSIMDFLNRITNEIRRHVSDTEQFDDTTLLAARRKNLEPTKEL